MRISDWSSDVCSSDLTLLGSRSQGSQVDYGSLTAILIDGGLIYVRPFYVTSQQAPVPGLERVIVYFEGQVVIRETLQEEIGRASCREGCVSTCRSRWSPYH